MAKPGRKSYFEELEIVQRYADLSDDAFKVLRRMLKSKKEANQKWAVEQLGKGFSKMIPQDFTSGGQPINVQFSKVFESSP